MMEMRIEILYKGIVEMSLEKARIKGEQKEGAGGAATGRACSRLRKRLTLINLTGSPSPIRPDGRYKLGEIQLDPARRLFSEAAAMHHSARGADAHPSLQACCVKLCLLQGNWPDRADWKRRLLPKDSRRRWRTKSLPARLEYMQRITVQSELVSPHFRL